jgi:hypothetical protein
MSTIENLQNIFTRLETNYDDAVLDFDIANADEDATELELYDLGRAVVTAADHADEVYRKLNAAKAKAEIKTFLIDSF